MGRQQQQVWHRQDKEKSKDRRDQSPANNIQQGKAKRDNLGTEQ